MSKEISFYNKDIIDYNTKFYRYMALQFVFGYSVCILF